MIITAESIEKFREYLINGEKSDTTVKKYVSDVEEFALRMRELNVLSIEKNDVFAYREALVAKHMPASVNSVLSSLNSFFTFMNRHDLKVKSLKIQRQIFARSEKELSQEEYRRLIGAAKSAGKKMLYYLMQTICCAGIRISELKFITVESLEKGIAMIDCKGKCRRVFIPEQLCRTLRKYAKDKKITSGSIFITKNGKPLDRSNVWKMMKKLCDSAGVASTKVFPHNLRHLFARTYYNKQKDIVRLADILGHSNINTTRIYTMESGDRHRAQIESLGLLIDDCESAV